MDNKIEKTQNFLFYSSNDGKINVQVIADSMNDTIWTTQKGMAEIFGTTTQNITVHLKNIYNEGELENSSTCKEILQVQKKVTEWSIERYVITILI